MRIRRGCFNLFFGMALMLWAGAGCSTSSGGDSTNAGKKDDKPEKQASTLRMHLETESTGMGVAKAQVIRANPVTIKVDRSAFVDEGFIEDARVVDGLGGPMIYLKLTGQGALRLQMATVTRPGRRIAIWSSWTEGRWLGAPLADRPIEDGVLVFTPDATREEAERIVRGLNNVAVKLGNRPKPPRNPEKAAEKKRKTEEKKKPTLEEEMFLK